MRKIIWAIDAYQEATDPVQRNVIQTLRTIASAPENLGSTPDIEPVYVLPTQYVAAFDFEIPQPIDLTQETVEVLDRKFADIDIPGLLPPRILNMPAFTTGHEARTLIKYAQDSNSDLIVTGTHAKRGASRLFLGSFAESLILYSPVPVCAVGPMAKVPRRFGKILFPTDLEKESRLIFPQVLDFAKGFDAQVTLLHVVHKPSLVIPEVGVYQAQANYIKQQQQAAYEGFRDFLDDANRAGVRADFNVVVSGLPIGDAILRYSRKHDVRFIAMASRSGRLASVITGSVTRQVVRAASSPVWVVRAKAAAKARKQMILRAAKQIPRKAA